MLEIKPSVPKPLICLRDLSSKFHYPAKKTKEIQHKVSSSQVKRFRKNPLRKCNFLMSVSMLGLLDHTKLCGVSLGLRIELQKCNILFSHLSWETEQQQHKVIEPWGGRGKISIIQATRHTHVCVFCNFSKFSRGFSLS